MPNVSTKTKALILEAFAMNLQGKDDKVDMFIRYNDLGFPLAHLLTAGAIQRLNPQQTKWLDETYNEMCKLFNNGDPIVNVDSLWKAIDAL